MSDYYLTICSKMVYTLGEILILHFAISLLRLESSWVLYTTLENSINVISTKLERIEDNFDSRVQRYKEMVDRIKDNNPAPSQK